MDMRRLVRHLSTTHWRVNAAFPRRSLLAIERAVHASHDAHVGQVRFAVEGALHTTALLKGTSARARAIDVFSQLRVWDTEHNNGVLIYLLLADHDVEIVADRGIHAKVDSSEWEAICRTMEADFRRGDYQSGVLQGIERVTELLKTHFPASRPPVDEFPSAPVVM
ncbi:TPA: TPM domain-containing protein [Burkholderia multivorans]|uniref:TPM domain-containing protein n=1 Tax=Burkholderia multivorans TaxID=87883 RepID=UPI001591E484|nr:TPM domain-containing protein [Burkholderia multivorans]MBU9304160.1 TPM domain-containing protein [Burkholderia multivorans]MBU9505161.1 TPM domain-containing protein [Burkholderia multivorans]HDR8911415.1 TPM domain-containing protein [Burkholderia multivorans]HDR8913263.1 TPM domain-containing protein [Burkholderia multivorans]